MQACLGFANCDADTVPQMQITKMGCKEEQHKRAMRRKPVLVKSSDDVLPHCTIDPISKCWLWNGATNVTGKWGYAMAVNAAGRYRKVTRILMDISSGRCLSQKEYVCHTCDVPRCVNPDHLFIGSQRDNMRDASAKGRIVSHAPRTHCPAGHAYDSSNAYMALNKTSGRRYPICRICSAASARKMRARKEMKETKHLGNT